MKDLEDTIFLIYGDGDDRESLIQYCKEHNLWNVKFKAKWTDPKYVPFILSKSYLNILNYISSDLPSMELVQARCFSIWQVDVQWFVISIFLSAQLPTIK